jgi:hypothetical protein
MTVISSYLTIDIEGENPIATLVSICRIAESRTGAFWRLNAL